MKSKSYTALLFSMMVVAGSAHAAQPPVPSPTQPGPQKIPAVVNPSIAPAVINTPAPLLVVVKQPVQMELKQIIASFYGAPINLHAKLTSGGMPLANAPIKFVFEGLPASVFPPVAGTSDAAGNVDVWVPTPEYKVGTQTIKAIFDGDAFHKPAQAENTINVMKTPSNIDATAELRHEPVAEGQAPKHWKLFIFGKLYRTTDKKPLFQQPLNIRFSKNGDNTLGSTTTVGMGDFTFSAPFEHAPGKYPVMIDYFNSGEYTEITKVLSVTIPDPNPLMAYYSEPTVTMQGGAVIGQQIIVNTRLTTAAGGAGTPVPNIKLHVCLTHTNAAGNPDGTGLINCEYAQSNAAGWLHAPLKLSFGGNYAITFSWLDMAIPDGNYEHHIKFHTPVVVPKPPSKVVASLPKGMLDGDPLKFTAQLRVATTDKPADCYVLAVAVKNTYGTWSGLEAKGICSAAQSGPLGGDINFEIPPGNLTAAARPLEIKISNSGEGYFLPSEATFKVQVQARNQGLLSTEIPTFKAN